MAAQTWRDLFEGELEKPYMVRLKELIEKDKQQGIEVYPPQNEIFNAFKQTPLSLVKVVIMGQDPYHGPGQAHGLSFSVSKQVKIPPSLRNIFQEIQDDLGVSQFSSGCLIPWAQQGVLLLNATLSVQARTPKSHYGLGWEQFTDVIIEKLTQLDQPIVFMLWGKSAQEKCLNILQKMERFVQNLIRMDQ